MNLWQQFISTENFQRALANAIRGKRHKPSVVRFMKNADENLEKIRQSIIAGEYKTSNYRVMKITDPKPRDIHILPFAPDRIAHHAIMNVLAPLWTDGFIRDTYACIPGRGLHSASRRAMEFCRRNKYVLKCDIRKFYPSIAHDNMFAVVCDAVPDPRMQKILSEIIYSHIEPVGMPIGNLCSQWMGNLFLARMDDYIKQTLRVRDYVRYSDDFCLYSNDKRQLAQWRRAIGEFLAGQLGLEFSKSEIYPIANGVDFVGYRHFKDFILLRKRTSRRIATRMRRSPTIVQAASAHGWLKHACSYNFRKSIVFL